MKDLSACQGDAVVLHGLIQALEALDGDASPQAFQGSGALLVTIEKMAHALANDLEAVEKEARK